MLHRGDTDLRACASALQRALLRLTGVRAGLSFSVEMVSRSVEEGNRAEKLLEEEEGSARARKIASRWIEKSNVSIYE